MGTGEPITYRSIRAAVGGAPATIKRVLESLGLRTDARGKAEREIQVRERLREAGARLAEAEAYARGAKEASDAILKEISGALSSMRDAQLILLREIDALRGAQMTFAREIDALRGLAGQVARELAANRPAGMGDPLLEAKLRRATTEAGRMAQTIERLRKRLHEAGIEVDEA
jgi:hypothetical protein